MKSYRWLAAGMLAVLMSWASSVAAAEIAFVEVPRLLQEAPQVEAVRNKIKSEFSKRDNELVAQAKQIKQLEQKLERDGAIMSEEEAKRLERDIVARKRKLSNLQSEFQEDLALRQNEELNKLRKVIAEVVIEVSKEQKLDLVLESGVVYASQQANITDAVLERLRKKSK